MADHWTAERVSEPKTGWRGISIKRNGIAVANIVMQLDDSELKLARFIADACNAAEANARAEAA